MRQRASLMARVFGETDTRRAGEGSGRSNQREEQLSTQLVWKRSVVAVTVVRATALIRFFVSYVCSLLSVSACYLFIFFFIRLLYKERG